MAKKPRILFTTPELKHPAVSGPFLRIENSIKALSQISDLTIYCRIPISRSEIIYYQSYCQNFYCAPSTTGIPHQINRIKNITKLLFKKVFKRDLFLEKTDDKESDYQDFLRLADTLHPDIIWLGFGNVSYPLLDFIKKNSDYKVVCDTDSVWSRFILMGLPFAQNEHEKLRIENEGKEKEEEEQRGTQLADITTAVSEVDAQYYRKLANTPEQIKIFSNVIDLNSYNKTSDIPKYFNNPCIYLAGTFWPGSPMDEAARWTIEKVLPLLKKQIPDIHFYIIGNGSDTVLSDIRDPSITITGRLPSVLPYLCHANVAIVPLKFESGTRFKILEAGACGIPVVSTTLGAEGIPVTHGVNILIADDPENFATEIIKLLSDAESAKVMGMNLYSLIKEKYDISTLVQEGNAIINSMITE